MDILSFRRSETTEESDDGVGKIPRRLKTPRDDKQHRSNNNQAMAKITQVYYSSHFKNSLSKYHSYQPIIQKKLALFLKDPLTPSLRTHKLTGKLDGYYSFSINYQLRIIFEWIDHQTVGLIDIGTHTIYR